MKYRVIGNITGSRDERRRAAVKWLLYSAVLVFSYTLSRSGVFGFWQPVFLIPLSVAVAMREEELPSCVFALFCGLYIDCAFGFIFGFSAFLLVLVCLAASLLSRNLVQTNLLNFCWLTTCAALIEFFMDYLFNVAIWDHPNGRIILLESILPTAAATIIFSPPVYLLIKIIYLKFGVPGGSRGYSPPEQENEDAGVPNEQR